MYNVVLGVLIVEAAETPEPFGERVERKKPCPTTPVFFVPAHLNDGLAFFLALRHASRLLQLQVPIFLPDAMDREKKKGKGMYRHTFIYFYFFRGGVGGGGHRGFHTVVVELYYLQTVWYPTHAVKIPGMR